VGPLNAGPENARLLMSSMRNQIQI